MIIIKRTQRGKNFLLQGQSTYHPPASHPNRWCVFPLSALQRGARKWDALHFRFAGLAADVTSDAGNGASSRYVGIEGGRGVWRRTGEWPDAWGADTRWPIPVENQYYLMGTFSALANSVVDHSGLLLPWFVPLWPSWFQTTRAVSIVLASFEREEFSFLVIYLQPCPVGRLTCRPHFLFPQPGFGINSRLPPAHTRFWDIWTTHVFRMVDIVNTAPCSSV